MPRSLRALLVLLTLAFFVGCDSSDPVGPDDPIDDPVDDPTDEPALAIEEVSYVNKQIHNSHLGLQSESGFSRALDLTIDFEDGVTLDQIRRILVFGSTPAASLGWELGSDQLSALTLEAGAVLHVPNLVYAQGVYGGSDIRFEVTVEHEAGEPYTYPFIHKNLFPVPLSTEPAWYSREQLGVTLQPESCCDPVPVRLDGATAVWVDGALEVGRSEAISTSASSGLAFFEDVPTTATAFYAVATGTMESIETAVITARMPLPERIPANTVFVEGLTLSDEASFATTASGRFVILDHGARTLHVVNSDGSVAGPYALEPSSQVAFHVSGEAAYVGYESGAIDVWDLTEGTRQRVGNYEFVPVEMERVGSHLIVAARTGSYDEGYFVIDANTGDVRHEYAGYSYYLPQDMVYNTWNGRLYLDRGASVTPNDILSASFDPATGELGNFRESRYHGDYPIDGPLFLYPDGRLVGVGPGSLFHASSDPDTDLTYAGRFAYSIEDLTFDTDANRVITIRQSPYYNEDHTLDVYAMSDRALLRSITLPGHPRDLVHDGDLVRVLSTPTASPRLLISTFAPGDFEGRPARMPFTLSREVTR